MKTTSATRSGKNMRAAFNLFQNRRTMMQMIRESFRGKYRMSLLTNIILIASIFYVLFPFDLISDFIPFMGWIDDGFVIFLVIKRLQKETQRYIRAKVMERRGY